MEYKFSELFTWTSGKPINPSQGEIPVYGSNGIIGYTKDAKYFNKIILGRVGAYCGSVAYCDKAFNATDNTLITTCDESKIIYYYAFYLLKLFNLNKFAGGAAQPLITQSILKKLKCDLPPLPTQRKIASILSAYDSLIECNSKFIRLLEQMAENLYKEWFVRFRFPGHQNVKMKDGLPEGWKICRIGDVCETIGGGTPSTTNESYWNGDIKWVTPTDITSKSSLPLLNIEGRITEEGLKKSSAKLLPPYTLLMTSRASIGFFGLCAEEVCTNQGFISIIPNSEEMRMYLLYNLMSRKEEIVANANGSTFLEISKGRFRKMKIVCPPLELLKKFNGIVWKMFNEVLSLEQQSSLLTRQRDLLLPRLMSGKLEVCGVPK